MLEKYRDLLKDFALTLLANPEALSKLPEDSRPLIVGITTDQKSILAAEFDLSVNLSMNEVAWSFQNAVKASQKLGPQLNGDQLIVPDPWSSYLLTLKARAPFITFQLQDLYKNILGIKRLPQPRREKKKYQQIAMSMCSTKLMSGTEQEKLINLIHSHHPTLKIKDISEIDMVSDLSTVLYVGPAHLDALRICENEATGIFLTSQFQGFNLMPSHEGHFLVSSRGLQLEAEKLISFIDAEILDRDMPVDFAYAAYQIDEENLFGSYLRSFNTSDENYPFYQSHVVLWNFLLNLFDINLEVIRCSPQQIELLLKQTEVLTKLVRLYDYAMSSIDVIHKEAHSQNADNAKIQGHMKNLREMEGIADNISQTNSLLRPVLDFYRIRRGQNGGTTLLEQSQHSFLTYSEEHQALKALLELFTVTLRKNEVSI